MTSRLQDRIFDGAASWIDDNLERFDPGLSVSPSVWAEVPLSELAILSLVALRRHGTTGDVRTRRWTAFIADIAHSAAFCDRPFRRPDTLVSHLIIGAALAQVSGEQRIEWHRVAARILAASNLGAPSLPPHRMLELRHAADIAGVEHSLRSYTSLYRNTLLNSPINPIFMTRSEAYLVTHVVFYMTDLGHRSPHLLGQRERTRVSRLVDLLTGMYLCTKNWDLTAELLATSRLLDRPNAFWNAGWRLLEAAQDTDGSVPGYTWRDLKPANPGHKEEENFSLRYHTTLVSALAATICR